MPPGRRVPPDEVVGSVTLSSCPALHANDRPPWQWCRLFASLTFPPGGFLQYGKQCASSSQGQHYDLLLGVPHLVVRSGYGRNARFSISLR